MTAGSADTLPELSEVASSPPRQRRVLGIVGDAPTGVSYARFVQPFEHLRADGFRLATLGASLALVRSPEGWIPSPSLLHGADMVIFPQMVAAPALQNGERVRIVEPICRFAGERGIPVVWSVDDHLDALDAHNPVHEAVRDGAENLRALAARADHLIVTTTELARCLAHLGRPVHRLPNCVDPRRWRPRRRGGGRLRLGWAGSSSHLDDLAIVLPAIATLSRRIDVEFVVFGLTDRPIDDEVRDVRKRRPVLAGRALDRADAFLALAARLRNIPHRHVPFVSMEAYFEALPALDFDLGICPLADTPFNRAKSALKFYEYAVTGTMTVASAVGPYIDEVSVTVPNDTRAWTDVLERYLVDEPARDREWSRQRDFVLRHRDIRHQRKAWAEVLELVLSNRPDLARTRAAAP